MWLPIVRRVALILLLLIGLAQDASAAGGSRSSLGLRAVLIENNQAVRLTWRRLSSRATPKATIVRNRLSVAGRTQGRREIRVSGRANAYVDRPGVGTFRYRLYRPGLLRSSRLVGSVTLSILSGQGTPVPSASPTATATATATAIGSATPTIPPTPTATPNNGGSGGAGSPPNVPTNFSVQNRSSSERTETIMVSIPFAQGAFTSTASLGVQGHSTAWRVLQRWADNSIRIAQAQFSDTLAPSSNNTYSVVQGVSPILGAFAPNAWVAQMVGALSVGAEVRDLFGVAYRGFISGTPEIVFSTPLTLGLRYHVYHRAAPGTGIGRDYLTSTFYLTLFRDSPAILVDWIIGNDYLGADEPNGSSDPNLYALGAVDVGAVRFLVRGAPLVAPYRPAQEAIEAAELTPDGYSAYRVMQQDYIDDGQTRRYRFALGMIPSNAPQLDREKWQNSIAAMVNEPLYPLASLATWRATDALGLLGGPIQGPSDALARAQNEYGSFAGNVNNFGTWGPHGDIKATATTGTPRNTPLSPALAHALQGNYPLLINMLEQAAWAQAMRPYHLWQLQVPDTGPLFLWDMPPVNATYPYRSPQSLGRRAFLSSDPYSVYRTLIPTGFGQRAHQWTPYDVEHWSTDLLFDYYMLSGDAWALEELRVLGQCLKGLMKLEPNYYTGHIQTVRSEGWTMQSFAQVYQATSDTSIKNFALARLYQIIDPQRMQSHQSRALSEQGSYAGTGWPTPHAFIMPWQHGSVLYGFLGAHRFFQDPLLFRIAEDVAYTVQYSWISNYQDPFFGFVTNGLRYYVPTSYNGQPVAANYFDTPYGVHFGDSPLGGAHSFLIGGLQILSQQSADPVVRGLASYYGGILLGATLSNNDRWDKWHYVLPQTVVP
ncbi:MAG: hypothetical protein K1X79_11135 [Oligoflexia bacterium]|nr:hypothetical protein [Oligoflexia bacterium]